MTSGEDGPARGGSPAAEISNVMVQILRRYTGRGPTKARTTIGRDHVIVLLRDTLTQGERALVENGDSDLVLRTRQAYQDAMREDAISAIEEITSRKVAGMMSANHIDPDLGAEIFAFEPMVDAPTELTEGDSAS